MEELEELECGETKGMVLTYEIVAVKDIIS